MANKRLALVACKTAAEGPWTLAKGNENGIVVTGLSEGDSIWLDLIEKNGHESSIGHRANGTYMFSFSLANVAKYRVRKHVAEGTPQSATTVEVLLNGSAQGVPR